MLRYAPVCDRLTSSFCAPNIYRAHFVDHHVYAVCELLSVKASYICQRMGQSLAQNYLHIVFSTKNRTALIHPPFDKELYAYLGGICKKLGCPSIKVGGHKDHIHILLKLSPSIPLAELLMKLKANSSKWIKTKDPSLRQFFWQNGYGAFSVSPAQVDRVVEYIDKQEEHHKQKSFQVEYRAFLKKYNVEYDERYVWD